MITFSNKTTRYNFSGQGENFKIEGIVEFKVNNNLTNINASIYDLLNRYLGTLYYGEDTDGKYNKNLNNVEKENFVTIDQFVDEILSELELNIPK